MRNVAAWTANWRDGSPIFKEFQASVKKLLDFGATEGAPPVTG